MTSGNIDVANIGENESWLESEEREER